jgi:hypothetical protein
VSRTRKLARSRIPLATGLTVAGIAGITLFVSGAGGGPHPTAHTAHPAAQAAASVLPATETPVTGKAYSFRLLIHCGVPAVSFGGRAWSPVRPVPGYPGARPVNGIGITTETGYVTGTMTLVNAGTLRFAADARAVRAPFVVFFKHAATRSEQQPCA